MSRRGEPGDTEAGIYINLTVVFLGCVAYAIVKTVGWEYVVGFAVVGLIALWVQHGADPRRWESRRDEA